MIDCISLLAVTCDMIGSRPRPAYYRLPAEAGESSVVVVMRLSRDVLTVNLLMSFICSKRYVVYQLLGFRLIQNLGIDT